MSNVNIRTDIRMKDVFISWTGKDRELKDRIVQYLKNHSIEVLESDSECTGNFSVWSREAVSKCTVFLLLYTKNTLNSEYVPQEIEAFKKLDAWDDRIIPVVSSQKLYSEKLPDLLSAKVSAVEFTKESKDPTHKDSSATNDYNLDDLTDSILEEILKKVQKQITNRLFKIYREATKPAYLKLKSFLKMVNVQDREFNYEQLYINRSVLDENGDSIDDASVFTAADDIFFLQGPAGSGKSCYIDQLRKAANENTVVISVPCRKLLNNVTLFQAMFEEFHRNCGNRHFYTEEDFKSLLNARHLLLVLDGMDEIATKNGTDRMVDAVSDYYNAHASETTLFFTSRNKDDANLIAMNGQEPKRLTLCALEESQIATFGENLFMLLEKPDKSEAFYIRLKDLADEIRKNPLLVSQLAIIYDKNNDIPQTVVGIYDAICEITFSRDNNVSDVPAEYVDMITRRLPRILKAFSAERYRRASIGKMTDSRDDVVKILASILKGMGYNDARERAEFLEEYLRDRAIIVDNDFYHKMLLEYFTAVCFYERSFSDYDEIDDETALKELFAHYSDPYWSDVIKLFLIKADSSIDANETATLFESILSCGMTEYTLLFDTCRDLLRHKEEAQRTLLCDILKKSADGTYPPYGPMFWYVPEYEIYAPLLMALESLAEEECFTKALALVRDVCWIFGHYNTAKEITEDVDASALLSRANLNGVRLGLCELFYTGSTNETMGDNIYPRCFNLAEAKSWKENGQGVLDRMTKAFEDELGLYSHEMFSELNGEYIGIVAAPYDKERLEDVLPQKSHKKLCGLFFSPTKKKRFERLAINDKRLKSVYAPENASINDFPLRNFVVINNALLYFFDRVNLPAGITEIGDKAFEGCDALTGITIPDSVTKIGELAFEGCSALEGINIPDSVIEIADRAFAGCSSLTNITSLEGVKEIGRWAFSGCSALKEITIPDSVKTIGEFAFFRCSSLKEITIPNSVTKIGGGAFSGCSALKEITIPDSITRIGEHAFAGCSSLERITIPNSIKEIGDGAFAGCSSLERITIPNKVKEIDNWAFSRCSALKEITIPDSVARIGENAFSGCSSLKEIIIPNSVKEIGWHAFEGCSALTLINNCYIEYERDYLGVSENCKISYRNACSDNSEVLVIEQGKTIISDHEYAGLKQIKTIVIPYSVTEIGNWAFYDCSALPEITIPNSVTEIGDGAFAGCSALKKITIPDSVIKIGPGAFLGCSSLEGITLPNSIKEIGAYAFAGCSKLTKITIPDSVIEISEYAFAGCSALKEITIPNSVTEIGGHAFEDCSALTLINNCPIEYDHKYLGVSENCKISYRTDCSYNNDTLVIEQGKTTISDHEYKYFRLTKNVIILDRVIEIGASAFSKCSSLERITIPNSVEIIGRWAFSGCSSLTNITSLDGVKEIGEYAFAGCSSLKEITIPKGVTEIGDGAFADCSALKEITIPDSVARIGKNAFSGCSSLPKITIPKNVRIIGEYAFSECSALKEITIPDSVKEIGWKAFQGCSALPKITIPKNVRIIGEYAFSGCSSLKEINIPDSVKEIGWSAFEGCASLERITISKKVREIGDDAFGGCVGLNEITLSYRFEEDLSRIFSGVDLSKVKINWI